MFVNVCVGVSVHKPYLHGELATYYLKGHERRKKSRKTHSYQNQCNRDCHASEQSTLFNLVSEQPSNCFVKSVSIVLYCLKKLLRVKKFCAFKDCSDYSLTNIYA